MQHWPEEWQKKGRVAAFKLENRRFE